MKCFSLSLSISVSLSFSINYISEALLYPENIKYGKPVYIWDRLGSACFVCNILRQSHMFLGLSTACSVTIAFNVYY